MATIRDNGFWVDIDISLLSKRFCSQAEWILLEPSVVNERGVSFKKTFVSFVVSQIMFGKGLRFLFILGESFDGRRAYEPPEQNGTKGGKWRDVTGHWRRKNEGKCVLPHSPDKFMLKTHFAEWNDCRNRLHLPPACDMPSGDWRAISNLWLEPNTSSTTIFFDYFCVFDK